MAKNVEEVWRELDLTINWEEDAPFVSYSQIKNLGGEPRLVAKFDNYYSLPQALKDRDRFIMPAPGGYRLHKGSAYFNLDPVEKVKEFPSQAPDDFTFGPGSAEHMHLRYALREGVFHDFFETDGTFSESWSGRRFISECKYRFGTEDTFDLKGIQIEVDLGLVLDRDEIILVEGKSADRPDFNARQLFLPYLDAKIRVPSTPVRVMFFEVHDVGSYTLRQFVFKSDDITTLKEIKAIRYEMLFDEDKADFTFILENMADIPQANKPLTIIEAVSAVAGGASDASSVAVSLKEPLTARQGSYYIKAAKILGLLSLEPSKLCLSSDGVKLLSKSASDRSRMLAKRMQSMDVMQIFDTNGVDEVIKMYEDKGLSYSTAERRVSTISAWSSWVKSL